MSEALSPQNPSALSEQAVINALGALAQTQRLRAFRALVLAGPPGLPAGAIAAQLGISPSALSFHLKELSHAGLATSANQGRQVVYSAAFAQMNQLLSYLVSHCCEGQACAPAPINCCPKESP